MYLLWLCLKLLARRIYHLTVVVQNVGTALHQLEMCRVGVGVIPHLLVLLRWQRRVRWKCSQARV